MTPPSQDVALRDAERRWRESGAADDEARYLIERVRAGELTQERLDVAAYCGHRAAIQATSMSSSTLDGAGLPPQTWGRRLNVWTSGFAERWPGLCPRIPIGPAWRAAREYTDESTKPLLTSVLWRFDEWVISRDPLVAEGLERRLEELKDALIASATRGMRASVEDRTLSPVERRDSEVTWAISLLSPKDLVEIEAGPTPRHLVVRLLVQGLVHAQFAISPGSRSCEQIPREGESVQQIACSEVIAWALGGEDPVRARLARERAT